MKLSRNNSGGNRDFEGLAFYCSPNPYEAPSIRLLLSWAGDLILISLIGGSDSDK